MKTGCLLAQHCASQGFNKHFTGELYIMRQNDGRTRPGDVNVIGTGMRFRM